MALLKRKQKAGIELTADQRRALAECSGNAASFAAAAPVATAAPAAPAARAAVPVAAAVVASAR